MPRARVSGRDGVGQDHNASRRGRAIRDREVSPHGAVPLLLAGSDPMGQSSPPVDHGSAMAPRYAHQEGRPGIGKMTTETREKTASGGCLCGSVGYTVHGPLRDVLVCHCTMCQRLHSYVGAYSACAPGDLQIHGNETLRWYESSAKARRGFCAKCGAMLFWDPSHGRHISISAGSLDRPTGLRVQAHIYLEEQADFCASETPESN